MHHDSSQPTMGRIIGYWFWLDAIGVGVFIVAIKAANVLSASGQRDASILSARVASLWLSSCLTASRHEQRFSCGS